MRLVELDARVLPAMIPHSDKVSYKLAVNPDYIASMTAGPDDEAVLTMFDGTSVFLMQSYNDALNLINSAGSSKYIG